MAHTASVRFAGLCAEASAQRMTGRALLDHLHTRAAQLAGDAVACRLVQRLLHAATVPYFEILTKWVSAGVLEDPYEEFMVVEDASTSVESTVNGQAAFWCHRHAMRPRSPAPAHSEPQFEVPSFLQAHSQYVLAAGAHFCPPCTPLDCSVKGCLLIWNKKTQSQVRLDRVYTGWRMFVWRPPDRFISSRPNRTLRPAD